MRICMINSMAPAFIFAMFVEVTTGEKSLTIVIPVAAVCLSTHRVDDETTEHPRYPRIVYCDLNECLHERDADWHGELWRDLGLSMYSRCYLSFIVLGDP